MQPTTTTPDKPSLGRRIASFPLTCIFVACTVTGAIAAPVVILLHPSKSEIAPWKVLPVELALAAGAVAGQILAGWLLEKGKPSAVGWATPALRPMGVGFATGAGLQTLVVAMLAATGAYVLAGGVVGARPSDMLGAFLLFGLVAVFEEVLVRGILFRQLERLLGSWAALAITSFIFGYGHWKNPGASWISGLFIAIEAGVLLGAAFALTRSLWLPIGIHWAWNYFEGPVFGEAVSGTQGPHWLSPHIDGPVTWTGGVFGPEAGLAAVIPCTALGVLMVVLAVRRKQIRTPAWMLRLFNQPDPQMGGT
ncbi:MAG: CPBP family intramembrane metalloprotease [Deltaproteobacteria bacterium]|nr:CPBP family intramembrane metalloprotease [Deltaproteobacteria bacterium]